jgi:hypothetical protein
VCSSSASVCGKPKFGPCEFSAEERIPPREGMLLPLGRKSLDILIYLAERPGEVVAEKGTQRSDLVWRRYKGSLRVRMAVVRKALGERQFGKRSISNIDEGLTRWSVLSSTCEWHLGLIHYVVTRPRVCARDTACARLSTPSLVKTLLRCDFTVSGPILRLRAISLLDNPSAISVRMSVSRGLSELRIRAPAHK